MLKRFLLILTLMILLIPVTVFAATVVIETTNQGDGTWNKSQWMGGSYSNFSSQGNALGTTYYYYGGADRYFEKSYMQFDLSGFSGDTADIVSVSLNFNLLSTSGSGTLGTIWHAINSSGATGSASDLLAGGQSVTLVTNGSTIGWNSIDVTGYIINDFDQNYNFSAFSTSYSSNYDLSFAIASSESGTAPYLSIITTSAVPLPSSVVLIIGGLLGLIRFRRTV